MTLEEVKNEIQNKTGVPASFLTGETVEENITQAKALLAYKKSIETATAAPGTDPNKSNKQNFIDWISGKLCENETPKEAEAETWEKIEEAGGLYPKFNEAGEASDVNTTFTSTAAQFAKFINDNF